jgi:hypothetical protein
MADKPAGTLESRLAELSQATAEKRSSPQMSFWPDDLRAIPNETARSALFTIGRGVRRNIKSEPIFVLGDATITYRGEELRTEDEDVWLQIMHLSRGKPLSECIEFTPHSLLVALGWPTNKTYYNRLRQHLERMKATAISATSKRLNSTVSVSLIRRYQCEEEGRRLEKWKVWLEPEMNQLFNQAYYTQLAWEQRKQLTPLGKRLMDLYASHAKPFPMKLDTLRKVCGSSNNEGRSWRQNVRTALTDLVEVKFLESFSIDPKGLVHVLRA